MYSKPDLWPSHAKKNLPLPNSSLKRPLEQKLLKKIKFKMADFGPDILPKFSNSDISGTTRS